MRRLWIVAYDMADDRRRARLDYWLQGHGDRVLESVFECVWTADELPGVKAKLRRLIDPGADRLRLAPVCRSCRAANLVNGRGRRQDEPCFHIV